VAITVTCPNPNCRQMATVEDQHAGMNVQCPKCGGAIAVPGTAAPATGAPASTSTSAQVSAANFMANLQSLAGTAQAKMLLLIGLGCLAFTVLSVFLPWFGTVGVYSVLGLSYWAGILHLLLSLGAAAVVVIAVVLNRKDLFNIGVLSAAGWSAVASLWRIIDLARAGGASAIGLYLALLSILGAAGTLGFIAVQRLMKK
jgi:hypothetical protein